MILNITLPDELFARYADRDPKNPRKAIERALEKFVDVHPDDRLLLVPKNVRQELEKLIGKPIESWDKFLSFFKDALSIKAGEVSVPLTEGQIKRLKTQADFFKKDPLEFTTDMVKRGLFSFLGGA